MASELRKSLWLVPACLALHNLEEGIAASVWVPRHVTELQALGLPSSPSLPAFYGALFVVTLGSLGITALSLRTPCGTNRAALPLVIQAMVLVNAFVPHIAASLVLRAYTPGVLTAALVNVPVSLWLFWSADRQRFLSRKQIVRVLILGAALLAPTLISIREALS